MMNKRRKGSGRKIGSQNKVPVEMKIMIRNALEKLGGEDYLVSAGKDNLAAFLSLLGKIIPQEQKITGEIEHKVTPLTPQEQADRLDAIVRHRNKLLEIEHGTSTVGTTENL
jgi:hypothetical protein